MILEHGMPKGDVSKFDIGERVTGITIEIVHDGAQQLLASVGSSDG